MKFWISQGQAILSVFGRSRVTHFIGGSLLKRPSLAQVDVADPGGQWPPQRQVAALERSADDGAGVALRARGALLSRGRTRTSLADRARLQSNPCDPDLSGGHGRRLTGVIRAGVALRAVGGCQLRGESPDRGGGCVEAWIRDVAVFD